MWKPRRPAGYPFSALIAGSALALAVPALTTDFAYGQTTGVPAGACGSSAT